MSAPRIRWHPLHGDPIRVSAVATGYVGTLPEHSFTICVPDYGSGEHILISSLPGLEGKRSYGSPAVLETVAEEWLERFAASIGAVLQDPER